MKFLSNGDVNLAECPWCLLNQDDFASDQIAYMTYASGIDHRIAKSYFWRQILRWLSIEGKEN